MEPRQSKMGTMPVPRLLFSVSLPIMISMLVQALYNIVDSIYVARISEHAFTALSLAFPLQMVTMAVAIGTSVGMSSLISRRQGAQLHKQADLAAGNGISLTLLSSLAFVAVGLLLTPSYFAFVTSENSSPEVTANGITYLSTVLSFSPGIFLATTFEKQLQATGKTVLSMITQAAGAITNIILDPILIFGLGSIKPMGVLGAAVATIIGQFVSATIGLVFVLACNPSLKLTFAALKLRKETVREIYRVGVPSIVMQTIGSIANFLMNRLLVSYSDAAVSVLGAYFKVNSFIYMPLFGMNSGIIPITGYNYGARNKQRIMTAFKCGIISGVSIMLLGTALFMLFPKALLGLFDAGEQMLALGIPGFRIIALCFVPSAASIVLNGVFGGLGLGKYSMYTSLIRGLLVLVPGAWLLAHFFGVGAVWWAYSLAETIGLAVALLLFRNAYIHYIKPLANNNEKENPNA